MTYRWVASQYGTTWWHSHFGIQAYEGVYGGIIIHGPSSASYDTDAGLLMLQDWSHATVNSQFDAAQDGNQGGPITMDNGLINGQNTWGPDGSSSQVGKRFELKASSGKMYRIRIVNAAMQATFKFMIDGHSFTVIANDLVPIKPYKTKILTVNIGQRYDIVIHADQPEGAYWIRSDNQASCAKMIQSTDVKGILRYEGAVVGHPTTTGYNYTSDCLDEPAASLVPFVPLNPTRKDLELSTTVAIQKNELNLYRWYLDGVTFQSDWSNPTLLTFSNNKTVLNNRDLLNIEVSHPGDWIYVVIHGPAAVVHPIHLHGHDIFILASGPGSYSSSIPLNISNPPRRDVALLPAAGYLVIAFEVDNPGVWLLHCHIGWHVSMGFALQIIEQKDKIAGTLKDSCKLQETCRTWKEFQDVRHISSEDSGL